MEISLLGKFPFLLLRNYTLLVFFCLLATYPSLFILSFITSQLIFRFTLQNLALLLTSQMIQKFLKEKAFPPSLFKVTNSNRYMGLNSFFYDHKNTHTHLHINNSLTLCLVFPNGVILYTGLYQLLSK